MSMRARLFGSCRRVPLLWVVCSFGATLFSGIPAEGAAQPTWSTFTTRTGSDGTPTGNRPSNVVAGDLLIAGVMYLGGTGATLTPPPGWELIERTDRLAEVGMATYWRIATSPEPTSYQWTLSGPATLSWSVGVSRITGHDPTDPVVTSNSASGSRNVTPSGSPSVTTTEDAALILLFYSNAALTSWTAATGTTLRYNAQRSGGPSHMLATFEQSAPGTTSIGWAEPGTREAWVSQTLAIGPAPPCTPRFSITGGGPYLGVLGAPVGLSGSAVGVSYQLRQGTTPVGAPVIGTGGPLDFGLQVAGTYSVEANAGPGCTEVMSGTVTNTQSFDQSPLVFDDVGAGSWVVPFGVTNVLVEAWGGGGRGGSYSITNTTATGGLGGGGGADYARAYLAVRPGDRFDYAVGGGVPSNSGAGVGERSTFRPAGGSNVVSASGGVSVVNNGTAGASSPTVASVGDVVFKGGAGGTRTTSGTLRSGGGGASAGRTGPGGNASGGTGGIAPDGGANGATGRTTAGDGASGLVPGAGGAGAFRTSTSSFPAGGAGGNGRIILTWENLTTAPAPVLTGALRDGDTTVSGTLPPTGSDSTTVVRVFVNDVEQGSTPVTGARTTAQPWSVVVPALAEGDLVTARTQVVDQAVSPPSDPIEVGPDKIVVTIMPDTGQAKVFGEADPVLTFLADGLLGADSVTGTLGREPGEDVGTYVFTLEALSAPEDYVLELASGAPTFAITPRGLGLEGISLAPVPDQVFTGAPLTPSLSLTDGITPLGVDTDYTVAFSDNVSVGTATATITGAGNYTGEISTTFAITPAQVTVIPTAGQSKVFGANEPALTFTTEGLFGSDTISGQLARASGESVGTYPFTLGSLQASANYTLALASDAPTFAITPKQASDLTVVALSAETFTGSPIEPEVQISDGEVSLIQGTDFTVTYADNVAVGTATVTITGIGNYGGTQTTTFAIHPGPASQLLITAPSGDPMTSPKLRHLPFDVRVTLTDFGGNPVVNEGGATELTLTARGGAVSGTLGVALGDLDTPVTVMLDEGQTSVLVSSVLYTGLSAEAGLDVVIEATASSEGEGAAAGKAGESAPFSVRDILLTVEAADSVLIADGTTTTQVTVTLTDASEARVPQAGQTIRIDTDRGTLLSSEDPPGEIDVPLTTNAQGQVMVTLQSAVGVGTATVTALCPGACPATTTVAFVPGPASQLVLVTPAAEAVYGSPFVTQPVIEIQDASGNLVASDDSTEVTLEGGEGVTLIGSTSATASGGVATFDNAGMRGEAGTPLTLTFRAGTLTLATQTLEVDPAAPSGLTFATPTARLLFGTSGGSGAPSLESTGGEVVVFSITAPDPIPAGLSVDPDTGALSWGASVDAGVYDVTVTATNSVGSVETSFSLTVEAAPVQITPDAGQSKVFGEADPVLTFVVTGLQEGDELTGVLGRESGEAAGTYLYTLGTLTGGPNYVLALDPEAPVFTIEPKDVDELLLAEIPEQVYTGSPIVPVLQITDGDSVLQLEDDYTVAFSGNLVVGTATFVVTGVGNYVGTLEGDFTIVAKPLDELEVEVPEAVVHTGAPLEPDVVVRDGLRVLEIDEDYAVSYANNVEVGTASVTVVMLGNYRGTQTYPFDIRPATADAPGGLEGDVGPGQVTLRWTPPTRTGGTSITGYRIEFVTEARPPEYLDIAGGETLSATVTGLENDRPYHFRLATLNVAGVGVFSDPPLVLSPTAPVQDDAGSVDDLNPGEAVEVIDGQVQSLEIEVVQDTRLQVRGPEFMMAMEVVDAAGSPKALDPTRPVLRLEEGGRIRIDGEGFEPGTLATLWILSAPAAPLGQLSVGDAGRFQGELSVPDDLGIGQHTVQVTGLDQQGNRRAATLGVVLEGPEDLRVVVEVDNPSPEVGAEVTFTIRVTNAGTSASLAVEVDAALDPARLQILSAEATLGSFDGERRVWVLGRLEAGTTESMVVRARVVIPLDP